MIREKPCNFNAFLTFLLGSQRQDLVEFIHSLEFEQCVKLFRNFGGRSLIIPTVEELDIALKYFKIVELAKMNNQCINAKYIASLGLSKEEQTNFFYYYRTFKKNFMRLRDLVVRQNDADV